MPISIDRDQTQFHLFNDSVSYVMRVKDNTFLLHSYYGRRIDHFTRENAYPEVARSSFSPNPNGYAGTSFSLDTAPQEFPGDDNGDYRDSAFEVTYADGTKATALRYMGFEVVHGKPKLEGLPATYVKEDRGAESLKVFLQDSVRRLKITLLYTIFSDLPVITRSVVYENASDTTIFLDKAFSFSVDFLDSEFDLLQLPGEWAREKQMVRDRLSMGAHVLDSKRGASSVQQQPFMALLRPNTDENGGEVFAFHFVYSGNFEMRASVDSFLQTRVSGGISGNDFRWQLAPGQIFQSPEMVMTYSDEGLNGMSQAFHSLYRNHLARGRFQYEERPIIINNWETTYFDFDESRLLDLAAKAKDIGVELFVLDDGWFSGRNDDRTSLGDWTVDPKKLPDGIGGLSRKIHSLGLKFGLWFEPEMISERSDLFKAHPDWYLGVPEFPVSSGRNQLVLDFSRSDVRAAVKQQMFSILDGATIDFIKWDMNRNITEVASRVLPATQQMETLHRYILGLYEFLEDITTRYPDILFENCSGGGGRFDPGMSYYMPQSWASDDTDAIERLRIQYGTSLIFPPVMIDAHLSEIPNEQMGRVTPIQTRMDVAQSANFGLMMNLDKKSSIELEYLREQIEKYKKRRSLIQFGAFYRLLNPFDGNYGAWMFVDESRSHALVCFVQILNRASKPLQRVQLVGLDSQAKYQVEIVEAGKDKENTVLFGDELMEYGLFLSMHLDHDFESASVELTKIVD